MYKPEDIWEDYGNTIARSPYPIWDTMVELARRRRNRAKLQSYYKWLDKGNNYAKKKAYTRAYNMLPHVKQKKILGRRLDPNNPTKPYYGPRLTAELARELRAKYTGNALQLAKQFNIPYTTVRYVVKGRRWKNA